MLLSPVFADAVTYTPTSVTSQIAPQLFVFAGFILLFYFLIWQPQNKRQREKQQLLSALQAGDIVYTNSGIVGKITRLHQNFCELEVAPNVRLYLQKEAIAELVPPGMKIPTF